MKYFNINGIEYYFCKFAKAFFKDNYTIRYKISEEEYNQAYKQFNLKTV